jgi:predicted nucleotide-binding protein
MDEDNNSGDTSNQGNNRSRKIKTSNDIFIVQGRDNLSKETMARWLEQIGLKPIIFHEQVSESKTLIEKLETYGSRVQYAIVLLTPDDIGMHKEDETYSNRARQNVPYNIFPL